jgi:hypothetical protein
MIKLIRVGNTGIYQLPDGYYFPKNIYINGTIADIDSFNIISESEIDVFNVDKNTIVEVDL